MFPSGQNARFCLHYYAFSVLNRLFNGSQPVLTIAVMLLLLQSNISAQSIANYTFSTGTTASYTTMTGTTSLINSPIYVDDGASEVSGIGFTFYFMGVPYTQFSVNTNGQMALGSTKIAATGFTAPTSSYPVIAPLSGNNALMGGGSIDKLLTGSAPNRVLTVQWSLIRVPNGTGDVSGTYCDFQVKIYEATGVIEFVYGQMYNMDVTAQLRGIFISSNNTVGTVGTVGTISTTPVFTTSGTTVTTTSFTAQSSMTNLNSASNGSRRIFTFTPPASAPTAPSVFSVTTKKTTSFVLNWVDNSTNEGLFVVRLATDAGMTQNLTTNYVASTTAATTGTGYNVTYSNLTPGTLYYFSIQSANEGLISSGSLSSSTTTLSRSLSGTKTIGTGGTYVTLTDAFTDLTTNGAAGTLVYELLSGYSSASETFPLTLPSTLITNGNQITIRPASSVSSNLTITSANATATIDLNGCTNVTIDGRPGGTGSSKLLTITNTGAASPAIRFINEASNNTVKYCTISGTANVSTSSGIIYFSTTTGSNGNDNNTILSNNINCLGSAHGIYSSGTTTTSATANNGNLISDNNIYDCYISSSSTTRNRSIYLLGGTSDWTITGNRFYMTASRTYSATAITHYAISIVNSSGNGFVITNNVVGGSASDNSGTWTVTGTNSTSWIIFEVSVGGTVATSIQGNSIKNMNLSTTVTSGTAFLGYYLSGGLITFGDVTGNSIGNMSANSITLTNTSTGNSGAFVGVQNNITNGVVSNTSIGGITLSVTTASSPASFTGILLSTGTVTASNNTIGGTVANSINNATGTGSSSAFYTRGFDCSVTSSGNVIISGNVIQNMTASVTSTGSVLSGIYASYGSSTTAYIIRDNIIRNLSAGSNSVATGTGAPCVGINFINSGTVHPDVSIKGNTIYGLSQSSGTQAGQISGIVYSASSTVAGTIEKNKISNITSTLSSGASLMGVNIILGAVLVRNNYIRLGVDTSGSLTASHLIYGISKTGSNNISAFNNSVYIGGTGVTTGTEKTFCFKRITAGAGDSVMNNIFMNARSNATGTGIHYALAFEAATSIISNYNILYAPNTGGQIASSDGGTTSRSTLVLWQTNSLLDGASVSGNPLFVNPEGSGLYFSLQTSDGTVSERNGIALANVTDDFDAQSRSSRTPADIGAWSGLNSLTDIFPPAISFTAFGVGSVNNRLISNAVNISDATGMASGLNAPRLYFKRSTDSDVFNDNTNATDGWKYVTASGTSPYSFTINYSLLNGGTGVAVGNTVQYFVVAQDTMGNFTSLPVGATSSQAPYIQNINGKATTPYTYTIVNGYSGAVTVGTGGTFTTLTGAGGLFASLIAGVISGNITASIISNLSENGANSLTPLAEEGEGNYSITIQSNGSAWTISNSSALSFPLLNVNGACRVTITGGTGNTRNLTLRNTHTTAASTQPAIQVTNSSTGIVLSNLVIESNATTTTLATVMIGGVGRNSLTLLNNVIRDATAGTTGAPYNGFYMNNGNSTITASYNKVFNFTARGFNISNTASGDIITNNSVYQSSAAPSAVTTSTNFYGIYLFGSSSNGHTIESNYVGGQDSLCGGSATVLSAVTTFYGIYIHNLSATPFNSIQGNTVSNFNLSTTSSSTVMCIYTGAGYHNIGTITGNTVGHSTNANSITHAGTAVLYGLQTNSNGVNISNNTIANITATNTGTNSGVIGIYVTGSSAGILVSNNTIDKLSCSGTKTLNIDASTQSVNAVAAGIITLISSTGNVITGNRISNLSAVTTAATSVVVVGIGSDNNATLIIEKNKIYGLVNTATGTATLPGIAGIRNVSGTCTISNNMISLTNGANTNAVKMYGMYWGGTQTQTVMYNSVYIAGSPGSGSALSAGMVGNNASATFNLKNNLLYNARTNSGTATGYHYGVAFVLAPTAYNGNFNLFTTTAGSGVNYKAPYLYSFSTWKAVQGYDYQSFSALTSALSSANLFINTSTGDLSINTLNTESWAVNQKGVAISGQPDDYDHSNVRSVALPGSTDIGADEMTPSVAPPAATAGGSLANSGTSNYADNGKTLGALTFGASGTVPSAITFKQFNGTNPPGTLAGNNANTYWNISPTGGSGYSYDVVLYYDSTMLGSIPFESNIRMAKTNDGGNTYTIYQTPGTSPGNYSLDTINNCITVYGLSSFSDFTFTDGSNPLPVELTSFTATVHKQTVTLNWITATEVNVNRFEIERAVPVENHGLPFWINAGTVRASGNSNSQKEYSFTDKTRLTGSYVYRLKMTDNDGSVEYSPWVNVTLSAPKEYALLQNYPNPFNPATKISFEIPVTSAVKVVVYNSTGEMVKVLESGILSPGSYDREFDGKGLSSGLYLCVLQANGKQITKKMVLLK